MGKRVKLTESQFKNVLRMALHESIYNDLQLVQSAPDLVKILNSNTVFDLIAKNTEIEYSNNLMSYDTPNYGTFLTILGNYEINGEIEFIISFESADPSVGYEGDNYIRKMECNTERIYDFENEKNIPLSNNDIEVLNSIISKTLSGVIEDDMGVKFDLEVPQNDDYRE